MSAGKQGLPLHVCRCLAIACELSVGTQLLHQAALTHGCCAGDSNSASAARAAIAVLASQQSAHSLPEQMRQKLVELVDDRLHHLQGPPESAALGASFVAGV